jgi:uncharacterized protein (TIGR04255 family)
MSGKLHRKPLLEAIFELKWKTQSHDAGLSVDPDYSFLIGLFKNAVRDRFPEAVQLPASQIPVEMASHVAQYQFRVAENQWPLVQLGPGVMTVNETSSYEWNNHFEADCKNSVKQLLDVHPHSESIQPVQAQLRFINGIFIEDNESVLSVLERGLNTHISLPDRFGDVVGGDTKPWGLGVSISYQITEPASSLNVKLNRGKAHDRDALIWEISVVADGQDAESFFENSSAWLDSAHIAAESAFFAFLSDELLRRFEYDSNE